MDTPRNNLRITGRLQNLIAISRLCTMSNRSGQYSTMIKVMIQVIANYPFRAITTRNQVDTRNHIILMTLMNHMEGLRAPCSQLLKTRMTFLHPHPHIGAARQQLRSTTLNTLLQTISKTYRLPSI